MPERPSTTIFKHMSGQPGSKLSARQASAAITKLCEELDYDPLKEMINLAQMKTIKKVNGEEQELYVLDAASRYSIAKDILPYLAPKMKTVDLQGDVNAAPIINVQMVGGEATFSSSGGHASGSNEPDTKTAEAVADGGDFEAASSSVSVPVKVPKGTQAILDKKERLENKNAGLTEKAENKFLAEMELLDKEARR